MNTHRTTPHPKSQWFTIAVEVPVGEGDYGSRYKVVSDKKSTSNQVKAEVESLRSQGSTVLVFSGKGLGKIINI